MNELKFIDTPELKFHHNRKGVNARYNKKKFILGTLSVSHQNITFSQEDYLNLSKNVLNFECSVRGFPKYDTTLNQLIDSRNITNDYGPFYKYVDKKIFQNKILKGNWQLGNIHQYRTIENKKQRDEFEGFSFLNLNINNHIISQVCNAGFNYLILCGTRSKSSSEHKNQFGEQELFFPDIKSFAVDVCKEIKAIKYFIHKVEYNSLKTYINPKVYINENINVADRILVPEYLDILYQNLIYPSLFVKPEAFSSEDEVRIVFEMPRDYNKPYRFKNKKLLKHIQYQ